MGVLLVYPILIACWLIPPFLIFRSLKVSGWNKVHWVIGCLLSALLPMLIVVAGIAIAVHAAGYQRDLKAVMFGPEATVMAMANITSLVLPWIVYFVFKKRNAQEP